MKTTKIILMFFLSFFSLMFIAIFGFIVVILSVDFLYQSLINYNEIITDNDINMYIKDGVRTIFLIISYKIYIDILSKIRTLRSKLIKE